MQDVNATMEEKLAIRICDINPHIVCSLCAGYFIDATTITECLHTFCKSCIVKCLQINKCCPQCNLKIHETMPLISLRTDRTMQDIVYKIVPGLYENEETRRQKFYKSRGLVKEKKHETENVPPPLTSVYDDPVGHYYRHDEQLCMCLERYMGPDSGLEAYRVPCLQKKFVRCSIRTCVHHVKHLLRKKLLIPNSSQIDILCCDQVLNEKMTLKQVWLTWWLGKSSPLMLYYRVTGLS